MSNRLYDILKWTAIVALPAVIVFITALTPVWDIPNGDKIVLTIAAINVLLGSLVGVSGVQHQKAVDAAPSAEPKG